VEQLAQGSGADVFLATRPGSTDRFILELTRPEVMADPAALERFMAEARTRRALTHPHVTRRVKSGYTKDGRPYFMTENINGGTLRSALQGEGPFSPADVAKLMIPLCEALDYLHQHGFVHGNLCPENVHLAGGINAFNPKLYDSGLPLFRTSNGFLAGRARELVRVEYMAPERILGQRASPPSDVYSLGIIMFELLTGMPPFREGDVQQTRTRQLHDAVPPLPTLLQALEPILQRCLAKLPSARFGSARALRQALEWVTIAGLPKASLPAAIMPPGPLPKEMRGDTKPSAPKGTVLGSYELVRTIGQGAMGQVYLGRHVTLGREVAVKLMKPELARNPIFTARFLKEAQAVNRIRHPHIVEVYDHAEVPGPDRKVYCVMELLEGHSLSYVLKRGPIAIARAIAIIRQTCDALEAAHRAGVVHRDVKPDNIFLTERDGNKDFVKLLDFGVAKVLSVAAGGNENLTIHGDVIGTPAYMAPEQAAAEEVDARADIYAVGTLLYRMLAGKVPFISSSVAEQIHQVIGLAPPPLPEKTALGEPIPSSLAAVVIHCLEKDPDKRPQTMVELAEKLQEAMAVPPPPEGSARYPLKPGSDRYPIGGTPNPTPIRLENPLERVATPIPLDGRADEPLSVVSGFVPIAPDSGIKAVGPVRPAIMLDPYVPPPVKADPMPRSRLVQRRPASREWPTGAHLIWAALGLLGASAWLFLSLG
jgi:serine/threonine protein kinase